MGGELALGGEAAVQAVEHGVEGVAEFPDFVVRSGQVEPFVQGVVGVDPLGGGGDLGEAVQRATAGPPGEQCGECGEEGQEEQGPYQ
nr:hypothetical protein [Streptomyces sp. NA04227]